MQYNVRVFPSDLYTPTDWPTYSDLHENSVSIELNDHEKNSIYEKYNYIRIKINMNQI